MASQKRHGFWRRCNGSSAYSSAASGKRDWRNSESAPPSERCGSARPRSGPTERKGHSGARATTARCANVLLSLQGRMVMNVKPPIATELWQQIPPPVQSALLEAWEEAERRRQSLEDQILDLKARLDPK